MEGAPSIGGAQSVLKAVAVGVRQHGGAGTRLVGSETGAAARKLHLELLSEEMSSLAYALASTGAAAGRTVVK